MSDSDENYVTFGVPLDPLDEESIPRKKPVTIEDQYAYDAQGRRRFHGAFTGGFSAGYFNTVGTRDGWRPQQFKSSRSSKADSITQRPEDFMDEEDTSLFGIAPKGIRATSDYDNQGQKEKKRKKINQDNKGPIPGTPVLKELLKPIKETVGIILLKKMGWRPGQGVGSRLTKKEKRKIKLRNERLKLGQDNIEMTGSNSENSDDDSVNITFAPDDYEPFRCKPKDNYFGIGYSGLDRRKVLSSHINLFETPAFCVQDKNKKLSIHGQAFGVGAFEADDEDIYEREDMSRYDFALGPERKKETRWSQDGPSSQTNCLEGFVYAKGRLENKKIFKPPELPKDFAPVHTVRKSRFHPPITVPSRALENNKRRELNAVDRARILEDSDDRSKKPEVLSNPSVASNIIAKTLNLYGKQQTEERKKLENQHRGNLWLDKLNAQSFVKGGIVDSSQDEEGSLKKLDDLKASSSAAQLSTDKLANEDSSNICDTKKLFLSNPEKQRRFEQYLSFLKNDENCKLESIQPLSMTDWEREQERTEFEQAAKLDQANNYMADRFVPHNTTQTIDKTDPEKDMKQAAKMKMFGKLTHERVEWKPASIVCKRFNIPEPKIGCSQVVTDRKTTKFSVFDSLDWCNSSKFMKATDVTTAHVEHIPPQSSKQMDDLDKAITITKPSDMASNIHQISEPVAEKFRNFEASYEKVFGKGFQNTASKNIKDMKDVEDNLKNTNAQAEKQENNDNDNRETSESATIFKDKSEEKKDLFKAIFLSSSEDSESDSEEDVNSEAVKSVLIGKDPKEINVQRNTSPPRGIFAKLDLDSLIIETKCTNDRPDESTISKDSKNILPIADGSQHMTDTDCINIVDDTSIPPDMYGPILPQRLLKQEDTATTDISSSQSIKPTFRSIVVSKTMDDPKLHGKWVEREKLKKSKKDKKHKHKEHKSPKHKKKSKKEKRSKR